MRDLNALFALFDERAARPFEWGDDKHDCISFGDRAVFVQTGDSPIRRAGYHWSTERGAVRLLKRVGGLAAAVDLVLRRHIAMVAEPDGSVAWEDAPALAHRGDIGLADVDGRQSLVVIEGHLAVGPGLDGLVRLQRSAVTIAWSAE